MISWSDWNKCGFLISILTPAQLKSQGREVSGIPGSVTSISQDAHLTIRSQWSGERNQLVIGLLCKHEDWRLDTQNSCKKIAPGRQRQEIPQGKLASYSSWIGKKPFQSGSNIASTHMHTHTCEPIHIQKHIPAFTHTTYIYTLKGEKRVKKKMNPNTYQMKFHMT